MARIGGYIPAVGGGGDRDQGCLNRGVDGRESTINATRAGNCGMFKQACPAVAHPLCSVDGSYSGLGSPRDELHARHLAESNGHIHLKKEGGT